MKRKLVDVFATSDALPAALEAASLLFRLLQARGHSVMLAPNGSTYQMRPDLDHRENVGRHRISSWDGWRPYRPTVVMVGTVAIGLTVFEVSEDVEATWTQEG
jgi:hypothetical protein